MRRVRAFTLIELLVTMVVIAILSSMVMFAMFQAQETAKIAKTKALITKLDVIIKKHWEAYKERRIPMPTRYEGPGETGGKAYYVMTPEDAAWFRLRVIRQLMRLELPERWLEVAHPNPPANSDPSAPRAILRRVYRLGTDPKVASNITDQTPIMERPTLSVAYKNYHDTVAVNKKGVNAIPSLTFESAECLYMIVTIAMQQQGQGLQMFADEEIADVDDDGVPEFVDAWGNPIRFIRWPVGFNDDPRHDESTGTDAGEVIGHLSDIMPPKLETSPCKPDAVKHHDPFDPLGVDDEAYYVYPLIVSAGPDGWLDLYTGPRTLNASGDVKNVEVPGTRAQIIREDPYLDLRDGGGFCVEYLPTAPWDEFASTSAGERPRLVGRPKTTGRFFDGQAEEANGQLEHYDNIHNHQMRAKL